MTTTTVIGDLQSQINTAAEDVNAWTAQLEIDEIEGALQEARDALYGSDLDESNIDKLPRNPEAMAREIEDAAEQVRAAFHELQEQIAYAEAVLGDVLAELESADDCEG